MSDVALGRVDKSPLPSARSLRVVIEEFGRILEVLNEQLVRSVDDASQECVALGEAFHQLAGANTRIDAVARAGLEPTSIPEDCAKISQALEAAVVALQYHDRLAQRIGHVCGSLNDLQVVLRDGGERSYDDWLDLLRQVEHTQKVEQARLNGANDEKHGSSELF